MWFGSFINQVLTHAAYTRCVIAARYSRLDLKSTPIKTIFVDKKKVNRDTKQNLKYEQCEYTNS